jgi:cytochrome c2
MPDRKDFPGSWLAVIAAITAAGVGASRAQMPLPPAVKPTGADLFNQQCVTCHSLNPADPPRQGPLLAGVYGRKPGSIASAIRRATIRRILAGTKRILTSI